MLKKYSTIELFYGLLFFVVHIAIETVSYMLLYLNFSKNIAIQFILVYDFFAFVPQALIGEFNKKYKNVNIGYIGVLFFLFAIILVTINKKNNFLLSILFLSFGNAILHESGAIKVASVSKKNIFPSALFVAGGTVGIIIGKYLAELKISLNYSFIPIAIILIILIVTNNIYNNEKLEYIDINITNDKYSNGIIFVVAFIVVMLRSYMGFVVPLSWKENFFHFVLVYISLGVGKAIGGYFCDKIGYKIVSFISTIICLPFILCGNNYIIASLIGLTLFSMTMSITYAMLLSIIKQNPGVAFGVSTIALFVGAVPMFIFRFDTKINTIIIVIMSLICFVLLNKTLKR